MLQLRDERELESLRDQLMSNYMDDEDFEIWSCVGTSQGITYVWVDTTSNVVQGSINIFQTNFGILIDILYVKPEYRYLGVGRELVKNVIRKHNDMVIYTNPYTESAEKFFGSIGFEHDDTFSEFDNTWVYRGSYNV